MALLLYIPFALFFIFIFNGATYTDMEVIGVDSDLPADFLDSHRKGDEDFIFYQFDVKAKAPLSLEKIIVFNEKGSKLFEYFNEGKHYTYLEEDNDDSNLTESIVFNSNVSLATSNTLEEDYWKEESDVKIVHFHETDLNVLFVFQEGNATVFYKFRDREERYTAPIYYLGILLGAVQEN